ncbi:MAG: PAS domain S-box protein [Rhodocyclales bacterium GT-UBC]|nr:MAG: PAS domain S-box protein [Rhodocyclales bacterium GT-UBC]
MKRPLIDFFRWFLPMAGAILLITYFYVDSQRFAERSRIESVEMLNVKLGAGVLDRRVQMLISDLRALATDSSLKNYIETSAAKERQEVEDDFVGFSLAKPSYDKIRWFDIQGNELIRIDRRHGRPQKRLHGELQNKAERYFFTEGMALPAGGIYVSPLDLNIEGGQIEVPHKPTLRIATPLSDRKGKKRGLLILNYLSAELLDVVAEVAEPVKDHLYVVNRDGFFLMAPNKADEWGFLLDHPENSLAVRFPDSWKRLSTTGQGQFTDSNGLWTIATVYPLQIADMTQNAPDYQWKVITHLPPGRLAEMMPNLARQQIAAIFVMLALAALIALFLTRIRMREKEVEVRFRIYFERAMVGMAISTPEKRWHQVNPALCKMLGYSAEELLKLSWSELTHPEDLAQSNLDFERVMRGDANGYEQHKRYIRKDGQLIDTFISAQAVRKPNGTVDYFLVIIEDVTSRQQAEKALRDSEERLRQLGNNLPDSYVYQCIKQNNGEIRFLYISSGVQRIHGISPDAVLADPGLLNEFIDPSQLGELYAAERESMRTLSDFSMELRARFANGEWGWVLVRSRPRRLVSGEIIWDGVASDITGSREIAAMLKLQARRSSAMLELPRLSDHLEERDFMQHALDLIEQMTDSKISFMHFVNMDENSIELAAWSHNTRENYCTAQYNSHYPISQAGIWADAARLQRPVVVNDYANAPNKHGMPEGHSALTRLINVPVLEDGHVRMVTGAGNKKAPYTDSDIESIQLISNEVWRIVSHKRAENALRIATQVVNASPVVCFRWRADDMRSAIFVSENITRWGYRAEQLLAGKPAFRDLVHPEDLAQVSDEIARLADRESNAYVLEYRLLTAEQKQIWVLDRSTVRRDEDGRPCFYDSVLTDISERKQQASELTENLAAQRQLNKRLEEAHNQLLQSEKMASIGQLAAGVAHELNNPIGFVHSNLGTLESYLIDVMNILDAQDRMLAAPGADPDRQASIARLKEEHDFDFVRQDIAQLLSESKDGLSRVRKIVQDLKNFSHVSEQEWQWADLHQGLDSTLNIVWNELKYKCKIVKEYGELPKVYCLISQLNQVFMNLMVNAGHAIEEQGTITLRTAREGDDKVRIEISDTGKGIAPEHLNRIFEPFFTTKPVGKGTGLGLSLAYGIIDKHHGRIDVESTPGVGTTFRILIPINPEPGATVANASETSS